MYDTKVFISVKFAGHNRNIFNKVATRVNMTEDSLSQVAKELRLQVCKYPQHNGFARNAKIKPSDFAWAVYSELKEDESETPILTSKNW